MTLTEQIAAVLRKHDLDAETDGRHCKCGAWLTDEFGGSADDYDAWVEAWMENFARHQAAHLAPLVRQAQAEAWDEGHRTGWGHCQDGNYGTDYWDDDTPNPYRADRIEAEA